MGIPKTVTALLREVTGRQVIGFSGSRLPDAQPAQAAQAIACAVARIGAEPGYERPVHVGDARGWDSIVRDAWRREGADPGRMTVYFRNASSRGRPHAALIERSTRLAVNLGEAHRQSAALLIAGPAKPCPWSILPTGVWIAGKDHQDTTDTSGTWSTVGVAIGVGVPCLLYLPVGRMEPPQRGAWNWMHLEEAWWWHDGIA